MAITAASSRRRDSKPVNPFEKQENVINLALDKKLKLQLKTKAMLEELKTEPEKKYFKEKYDDLLDINKNNTESELDSLTQEISDKYIEKKGAKELLKIEEMIDAKLAKLDAQDPLDTLAEDYFDSRVQNNIGRYKTIEALETAYNKDFREKFWRTIDLIIEDAKHVEMKEVLKSYRFEIEIEAGKVLNKDGLDDNLRRNRGYETMIGPDISAQVQETKSYIEMTKKERKEEGFVDNYRKRNRQDKVVAMKNILDELDDEDLAKKLKRIELDDFVGILDDVVFEKINIDGTSYPNFISYVAKESKGEYGYLDEKLFRKTFKAHFKKEFIKTGKYKKKGVDILQRNENNILSDIFLEYVQQIENKDTRLQKEFARLADASQEGIHYTGQWNSELMLRKVSSEDTFNFLCDFNSDGKIDGGRDGGDRGSIMGLQLYENFLTFADTERDENNMQTIVDGPKTSALITNILSSTREWTENKDLQKSITYFLEGGDLEYMDLKDKKQITTLESGKDDGNYTIENFFAFMKGEFEFGVKVYAQDAMDKQLKTPETYDIKEFLINQGNQINEQRNVAELFMDKDKIRHKTQEAARNMPRVDEIRVQYQLGDVLLRKTLDDKLNAGGDRSRLSSQLKEQSQVTEIKKDLSDKILMTVFAITDYIFFNLGEDHEAWANMFGKALGIGQTRFKDSESFRRNKQKIRDALGEYLVSKVHINANLSVAQIDGKLNPALGFGIGFGDIIDTQKGKSNRFGTNIQGSFLINMRNFRDFKCMISPSIEYAMQVNKDKVKRLSTKKPVPVNRIGIEGGAGFNVTEFQKTAPYLGFFFERDYVSGLRQYENTYEKEIKKILFGEEMATILDETKKKIHIYKNQAEFIRELNKKVEDNINQEFLKHTILQLAELMEWGGTFELINDTSLSEEERQNIVRYVYESFIAGVKENLIAQNKLNQLEKGIKLTKCGLRFNVFEVAKVFGAGLSGAAVGSMIPGLGTVIGGILGATMGSVEFTRYKNHYSKDIHKGLLNYQAIGNFREINEKDLKLNTLQEYGTLLEKDINGRKKYLQVESSDEKDGTLTISSAQTDLLAPGSVLDHMNVYYSEEALKNGGFSYDGDNLVLGDVEFTTYKVINQDSVEVFMMIGNNLEGPLTQLTSADTGLEYQTIKKIEKEPLASVPFTREKLLSLKAQIKGISNPEKSALSKLQSQYEAWTKTATIPKGIVNGHVEVTKNPDKTFSFNLVDDGAQVKAIDNKLTLIYIEEEIKSVALDESYYKALDPISIESEDIIEYKGVLSDAKKLIDKFNIKNLEELERLEKKSGSLKTAFKLFMKYVNDNNLEKAKDNLIKILEGTNMSTIVSLLNDNKNKSNTELHAYVVDRFLALFAYEKDYKIKGTIKKIFEGRTGHKFLDKIGPDKDYKDLKNEIGRLRNEVINNSGVYDYSKGKRMNNLIGYTVFYRRGTDDSTHGYGLTALSDTKIFETTKRRLSDEQQQAGIERVVNKFNEKTNEKTQFTSKIKSILEAHKIKASELTNKQIISLIKGNKVYIDDNNKILKMNVECVFYLLAECANESIGLEVKGIEVSEKILKYKKTPGSKRKSYGGEVVADREKEVYMPKWNAGTLNSDYDISSEESRFGVKGMLGHKRPIEPVPEMGSSSGQMESGGTSSEPAVSSGETGTGPGSTEPLGPP